MTAFHTTKDMAVIFIPTLFPYLYINPAVTVRKESQMFLLILMWSFSKKPGSDSQVSCSVSLPTQSMKLCLHWSISRIYIPFILQHMYQKKSLDATNMLHICSSFPILFFPPFMWWGMKMFCFSSEISGCSI